MRHRRALESRVRAASGALTLVVAVSATLACGKKTTTPVMRPVEIAGCGCVSAERGCEAKAGAEVRVVVDGAPVRGVRARSLTVGEACRPDAPRNAPAGRTADVTLGHVPGSVCVTGETDEGPLAVAVPIAEDSRPAWLHEALGHRAAGRVEDAEGIALAHVTEADAVRAESFLARIALSRGDARGAAARFKKTIEGHARAGRWSDEANDRFALAHTLAGYVRDLEGAAQALEAPVFERFPEGRARVAYYRAVVAHHAGRPREALTRAHEAGDALRALRLDADAHDADGLAALAALQLGRACDARERFLAIDAKAGAAAPPCARVDRLTSAATSTLRASGDEDCVESSPAEAVRLAREALALTVSACPGGLRRATAHVALARAEVARGDTRAAHEALAEAERDVTTPTHWMRLGYHEVAASVALADADSASAADHARSALALSTSATERWLASLLLAHAHRARGMLPEAVAAYELAEEALDALAVLVPLGEGRAIATATRAASAEELAAILLQRRDAARAFEVLRRARARVLRSTLALRGIDALAPEARARVEAELTRHNRLRDEIERSVASTWSVPRDERAATQADLAAREREAIRAIDHALSLATDSTVPRDAAPRSRAGDLDLLVTQVDHAWYAFLKGGERVRARLLGPSLNDEAWQAAVIAPLRGDFAGTRRLRVLATGLAQDIAVHTLEVDGEWMCEHLEVVYGVDVATVESAPPGERGLLVTDPSGDLPGARGEEANARAFLARRGGELRVIRQAEATRRAVLDALHNADTFLFAGHASFGGRDAVSAGLLLAGDTRLELSDVLALPRAPSLVVLSSCEAARTETTRVAALGVAQAFVTRGAKLVVAPREPVADAEASAFARAFYDGDASLVSTCKLARARGLDARSVRAFLGFVP